MPVCLSHFCSLTNKKEIGEKSDNFKKQEDWGAQRNAKAISLQNARGPGEPFGGGQDSAILDSSNLFPEQFQGLEIKKKKCSSLTRQYPTRGTADRFAHSAGPSHGLISVWK